MAHGAFQPLFVALRVFRALAEDVRLAVIDLEARQMLEELKDRTIVERVAARFDKLRGDGLQRAFGVHRGAAGINPIGDPPHERDVERRHRSLREHDHRAARPDGVPDAELVEHIGIGAGDVRHGVVAQHQPLEHRLVNGAADLLLIGADRLEPRLLDGGGNDLLIDRIEVGDAPRRVQLASKRHQHEAQRRQAFRSVHRWPLYCTPLRIAAWMAGSGFPSQARLSPALIRSPQACRPPGANST